MKNKNYQQTITVDTPSNKVNRLINEVAWWKKNFTGSAEKIKDRFTVPFGDLNGEVSFVDFMVSELKPAEKVVWKVVDSNLPWFKDKKEWNGTEVVFDLKTIQNKTEITFTHIGLVPEIECYEACQKGWDGHITKDLFNYIMQSAVPAE